MVRALSAVVLAASLLSSAQAPDRSAHPKPGPVARFTPPAFEARTLGNGLPVWIVERHAVPTVTALLVVNSGASADPAHQYGLASFTAGMLAEGAGGKPSLTVADEISYLGASLRASSWYDETRVGLQVSVSRLTEGLAIMSDVTLRPDFPDEEVARVRDRRITALRAIRDDAPSIAAVAFPLMLFGPSARYGTNEAGSAASLKAIDRAALKAFHTARFRPDNATLIVVGDVTAESVLPMLDQAFGAWRAPSTALEPIAPPPAPTTTTRRVFIVDKPGAAQSAIRIGGIGVMRSTPDYFAVAVMNTILGGSYTSRLNQNLRETHGYTYGARSVFAMRRAPGPFFVDTSVQTDKTPESITEIFDELAAISRPVSPEELTKAKNYLALGFPSSFDTSASIADMLAELAVYGLPHDYYATYVDRLLAVTAADIERVARRYIQPGRMPVVIVGDRQAIEARIRALSLGPVELLGVEDVVK